MKSGGLQANSDNIDTATVEGFGAEWAAFDQTKLGGDEYDALFSSYFGIFPFDQLPDEAEGFDLGCGSGRWAVGVLERVGKLHCIDPSEQALAVAKRKIGTDRRARFHLAAADSIPLVDDSQDFGYSLGVLHHVPDTRRALADCVSKLKPGAPFLLYLYYALDGRPVWFRAIWQMTDIGRRMISALPFPARKAVTSVIAALVYWPLSRTARLGEQLGMDASNVPLSAYRKSSYYTLRTDALDRFGTRLEQRFSRAEIEAMMISAGLVEICFNEHAPYWVAVGWKRA